MSKYNKIPAPVNNDFDLAHLFRVLNRRKWIIVITFIIFTGLAYVYISYTKPVYESRVIMKKEKTEKTNSTPDDITKIINQQSPAEIETEVELVKTLETMTNVVNRLMLFASVNKIVEYGRTNEINLNMLDYQHNYSRPDFPKFYVIQMNSVTEALSVIIQKADSGFKMLEAGTGQEIAYSGGEDTVSLQSKQVSVNFSWKAAVSGDEVSLDLADIYNTRKKLSANINVDQKPKTDVFELTVKSSSPYSAKEIANTMADCFREARINQQKQTIRYSYEFVEKNLEDIKSKLEEAENSLSSYKASSHIMDVSASSQQVTSFLTNLEAEKLNNELQMADYKNKYTQMKGELNKGGYFDQTFLSPQGNEPTNSPFSASLKQLNDLELQRLQLLEKRKENHPDVLAIDRQIKQVKSDLNSYNKNTLTSYDIMINSLAEKQNRINAMLGKYQGKMSSMPGQENRLNVLERQKAVYTKMYALLIDKREEMRMAELSKLQDIVIVDPARETLEPVAPKKALTMAVAGILGIFFGFIGLFTAEFMNKRFVTLDEIESDFKLRIFALIPNYSKELEKKISTSKSFDSRFVTLMDNEDGLRESYRVLRTKLITYLEERNKIVLLSSCEENTGKTSTVANLGISFAMAKKKVLLIDCDLKKATLSGLFDIPDEAPGLISYLKKIVPQPYIYNKVIPTLDILPAGGISENSGDLLGSERMKNLFDILNTSSYDYIIIDTPPVTRVVDTLILGKFIKDLVLVVRPNHTFKESVKWGMQEIRHEKMNIWGTVINAADITKSTFKYRYGYGYGYHYKRSSPEIKNEESEPRIINTKLYGS